MKGMKEFPDNYFDLAIVDPPYGIGEDGSKNASRGRGVGSKAIGALDKSKNYKSFAGNDKEPPKKEYFDELIRVSKNQIIWGGNHFISRIPYDSSCWVVWDKKNGKNDFADCELAYTSFKKAVRKFEYRWHGMLQEHQGHKEARMHPTQKPVDLYVWLLNNYAKQGDKILDTHVGSASSLIACHEMGYDFVGFELDEDYYKQSLKRLDETRNQLNLFDL